MVKVSNQLIRSHVPFATLPLILQTVWKLQRNASKQIWGHTRIVFSGLRPRVEFLLPVHQCVHGAGMGVMARDLGVMATKQPHCDALQCLCLCIFQDDATPSQRASKTKGAWTS